MQTVKLNNGVEMPILGFGVYQIEDQEQCENAVVEALNAGYRLIDTAAIYKNEEAVGRAIKRSGVPRSELFITTKIWVQDVTYEGAKKAFATSLAKLQLDYIDLYLIHQPYHDVYGAWRAMEELYAEKKIRAIGVSNFHPDRSIDLIMNSKVPIAVNQIELHPFYQRTTDIAFNSENGIVTESWAPFAEGINNFFQNEILSTIGKKYNKTVAQVTLRWMIQQGVVVIPKSVHADRIRENINVFDFTLTQEDMDAIRPLDQGKSSFIDHRDAAIAKMLNAWKLDTKH